MEGVVTVGLDIAKSVFQVHGVDATGQEVVQRTSGNPHTERTKSLSASR